MSKLTNLAEPIKLIGSYTLLLKASGFNKLIGYPLTLKTP